MNLNNAEYSAETSREVATYLQFLDQRYVNEYILIIAKQRQITWNRNC